MDLWQELERLRRELSYCVKELRKNGIALADAEFAYQVRKRAECLALRSEGYPVTLIQLTVYGVEEVAELRRKRDEARTTYEANLNAINATKLEMKIVDNQISRELGGPGSGIGNM